MGVVRGGQSAADCLKQGEEIQSGLIKRAYAVSPS